MRSYYTKAILIALALASNGPTFATHEGTWHGDGKAASTPFCTGIGEVFGVYAERACMALSR